MKTRILKISALALTLVFSLIFCACSKQDNTYTYKSDIVMNTFMEQKIYNIPKAQANIIIDKAFKETEKSETAFGAFEQGQEIYLLNQNGNAVLSDKCRDLILKSLEFSKKSDGTFDISVFPVSKLWKNAVETGVLPEKSALTEAKTKIDCTKISIVDNTVTLETGMGIDLGAVAKGAALDYVKKVYEENGVKSAVCSLGESSMLVFGSKGSAEFKIGLKNPFPDAQNNKIFAHILVKDKFISTSGAYVQNVEIGGKMYHHIIDTKTAYPAESDLASVTVLTDNGAFGDYMSTRLFIEGYDKAVKTAEKEKLSVVLVKKDKTVYVSQDMAEKIEITDESFKRV